MLKRQVEAAPPARAEHDAARAQPGGQPARAGHTFLQLQRARGNRHVQQVLRHARAAGEVVDAGAAQAIERARGGGQPLPDPLRAPLEQALGADFRSVRLHTDTLADRLSRSLQARAFTTGQDIFFRRGEYSPGTTGGQHVLAHELTHVAQQGAAGSQVAPGGAVIQRLLVQIGEQNLATHQNYRLLQESNPVEYRESSINEHTNGEVLHIVAHSDPQKFGGMTPRQLFVYLRRNGLRNTVGGIQLHGCESAGYARALEALLNTNDLSAEDPAEWWTVQGRIPVEGVPGYHFVTHEGTSVSVGAERGSDEVWERIKADINRDPSDERVRAFMESFPDDIRLVAPLQSSPDVWRGLIHEVEERLQALQASIPEFNELKRRSVGDMLNRLANLRHALAQPAEEQQATEQAATLPRGSVADTGPQTGRRKLPRRFRRAADLGTAPQPGAPPVEPIPGADLDLDTGFVDLSHFGADLADLMSEFEEPAPEPGTQAVGAQHAPQQLSGGAVADTGPQTGRRKLPRRFRRTDKA